MIDVLRTYYGIHAQKSKSIRGIPSYLASEMHYVVFRASEQGEFMMEQAVIAYYLQEQYQSYIALPIHNIDGQFTTHIEEEAYTVLEIAHLQEQVREGGGRQLATFHMHSKPYPYEPRTLSSYGQWKQLWIDKLTVYERYLQATFDKKRSEMERVWLDLFPYVIGITENAIQYVGEIETERSFNESDRPAIVFDRYNDQLLGPCFFSYELQYDHPMRDVAEWIRMRLLAEHDHEAQIIQFLADYDHVQPLSLFSWKMIYARLLFPVHFFDLFTIDQQTGEFLMQSSIDKVIEQQPIYEKRLTGLFTQIRRKNHAMQVPMVQWM